MYSLQLNQSGGQRRTLLMKADMAFIFRDMGVQEEFPLNRNIQSSSSIVDWSKRKAMCSFKTSGLASHPRRP
jgi:hypothetical protein